jgi:hypothetical protein
MVVDRSLPEMSWKLRREIGGIPEAGPGFAKWLADPKRGRFLIVDNMATTPEEYFVSVPDEAALIDELCRRVISQLQANEKLRGISLDVAPAVEAKIERLVYELNAMIQTGDYPEDGWRAPS